MAELNRIVVMLHEQRRELVAQLDAVDRAIAALSLPEAAVADLPPAPPAQADAETGAVLPTRVKPKRMLSDDHKQALVVSKRKAREVREAGSGMAREMPADSFVPAIGRRDDRQPPRLVKQRR